MQIELVGCTSAGKTTLARRLVEVSLELGIDAQLSDDFLLSCLRLNGIKNEFVRRRVIELWALLTCLMFIRKYREFYGFVMRTCFSAPGSVAYRLKLARVVLRKIGIYEIISRRSAEQQLILLDNEGMLQASHTLFVHANADAYANNLSDFLRRVPLPDVIVYLWQPSSLLIERTRKRGHNRIQTSANDQDVAAFIEQAVLIFEEIKHYPRYADRLLVINGEQNKLLTSEYSNNPKMVRVADLISGGLANHKPNVENAGECPALKTLSSAQR
jgi:thymidylate kinase